MALGLLNEYSYSYAHVTTAATTVLKATGSQGILHSIVVNLPGTTPVLTINDGANVVGVLTPTAAGTVFYDITFTNGCNIVSTGTGGDFTVTFQ